MSRLLLQYGSRRCMSVFKTSPGAPAPPTKVSNDKHIQVYEREEDVDQKKVTVPINPDIYPANTRTHTGQAYDADDYRNIRFINKGKLVNPRYAIDYIRKDPVVVCRTRGVWSDSGGPLGHPKVYLNLDKPTVHSCGYSGRKFIQQKYYDANKHGPSITYEEYVAQVRNQEDYYDSAKATPYQ